LKKSRRKGTHNPAPGTGFMQNGSAKRKWRGLRGAKWEKRAFFAPGDSPCNHIQITFALEI
jgi:hypothetical protein